MGRFESILPDRPQVKPGTQHLQSLKAQPVRKQIEFLAEPDHQIPLGTQLLRRLLRERSCCKILQQLHRAPIRRDNPVRTDFGAPASFLPQHTGKVSLPAQAVRPQPDGAAYCREAARLLIPLRMCGCKICRPGLSEIDRTDTKLRMSHEKGADAALILLRRKSAGRVHQRAALAQHTGRRVENRRLPFRTEPDVLHTPARERRLFLPEHPLSGARRIDQNPVKERRKMLRQRRRLHVCDHRMSDSHPLHILGENPRALRMNFIRDKKPLPLHHRSQLRRLSAGCRAQIKNALPRRRAGERRRRHRRRFLNIIKAGLMIRMLPRPHRIRIISSRRAPRHRRQNRF